MNGLKEIILSGRAPGVRCGEPSVNPDSVYAKVPRALREIERGERKQKHPIGARDISKLFGMSTDFIKKTWSKGNPKAFSCLLVFFLLVHSSTAGTFFNSGENFVDGQIVHASDLNNLVNGATPSPTFIVGVGSGSYTAGDFVMLSRGGTLLYYTAVSAILANPQSFTLLPQGYPNYTNSDLFQFYSAAGTNFQSITFSNLVNVVSSNANVAAFPYALTNSSGSNVFSLPPYGVFVPYSTNNQPELLMWGTNGVPHQITLTNFLQGISSTLGTNLLLGSSWQFDFAPWTIYGTNTYGFTNLWGFQTNFPITGIFMYNTNAPTLTNTDIIPVQSALQQTNTIVTLGALYQYFTNVNALPNYTQGRVQFNGNPVTETFTNMGTTTGIITNLADAVNWTMPTAVSLKGWTTSFATSPVTTSNQLLYAFFTNSSPMTGFQLFTNYAAAVARTNPILGSVCAALSPGNIFWMTNFTGFNADAIQVSSATSVRSSVYDVYFRSPSPTPFYYVTGSVRNNGTHAGSLDISPDNLITTNFVRIETFNANNSLDLFPLVNVLISPQ
jgi:hypothetical protein